MTIKTFHTKPVEVQAARWDGTAKGTSAIIEWVRGTGATVTYTAPHWLKVVDKNGEFFVHLGEWLVRDEHGEVRPLLAHRPRSQLRAGHTGCRAKWLDCQGAQSRASS